MLNSEVPDGKIEKVIGRGEERGHPLIIDGYVNQALLRKRLLV